MGISESQYLDFKRLNVRVIKEPLEEINRVAFIDTNVELFKVNKAVTALKFTFATNVADAPPVKPVSGVLQKSLVERFKLSQLQAEFVQNNYPSAYVNETLALVKTKHLQGHVQNLATYTLTALKNGYTPLQYTEKQSVL